MALVTIGLLSSAVAYSQVNYDSFIPERVQFNEFHSSGWPQHATASPDRRRVEILKPDDYLLANYSTGTDSASACT